MNRIKTASLITAALALGTSAHGATVLQDDFNDNSLDGTKWTALEGGAATVAESGGTLNLTSGSGSDRPYLATLDSFDPSAGAVTVTGEVTFGSGGSFTVWTRSSGAYDSNGQPNGTGVIGSGLRLSFWLGGGSNALSVQSKEDTVWPWTGLAGTVDNANLSLVAGTWDFVVTDDGSAVSLTVTNAADGSNTGSITVNTAFVPAVTSNKIVFADQGAQWDNITIDVVPEPSSLALLGLSGLLIARRRRF